MRLFGRGNFLTCGANVCAVRLALRMPRLSEVTANYPIPLNEPHPDPRIERRLARLEAKYAPVPGVKGVVQNLHY